LDALAEAESATTCEVPPEYVICTDRNLTSPPKDVPAQTLQLHLDGNSLGRLDLSQYQNMLTKKLLLSHSHISSIKAGSFAGFRHLEFLDLSNNKLTEIDLSIFYPMTRLKYLYLHGNRIVNIYTHSIHILNDLVEITLHDNHLNHLQNKLMNQLNNRLTMGYFYDLQNLTLRSNPWRCSDCSGPLLHQWLLHMLPVVTDSGEMYCSHSHPHDSDEVLPSDSNMSTVLHIRPDTELYISCLNQTLHLYGIHKSIPLIITLVILFILVVISTVIVGIKRKHLRIIALNKFQFLKRKRLEPDVEIDVYVIYDEGNIEISNWVLGELKDRLTEQYGMRVLVDPLLSHPHDSEEVLPSESLPRASKADTILANISNSRRTLFVISEGFGKEDHEDQTELYAFQQAIRQRQGRQGHRVIVVAYEDIDTNSLRQEENLKAYFDTNQCLDRRSSDFWQKLNAELPAVCANNLNRNIEMEELPLFLDDY